MKTIIVAAVAWAIGAALGFVATKRFSTRGWKTINALTAGAICLSTVFVRQHSVIDVFTALALCALCYPLVFHWICKPQKNDSVASDAS